MALENTLRVLDVRRRHVWENVPDRHKLDIGIGGLFACVGGHFPTRCLTHAPVPLFTHLDERSLDDARPKQVAGMKGRSADECIFALIQLFRDGLGHAFAAFARVAHHVFRNTVFQFVGLRLAEQLFDELLQQRRASGRRNHGYRRQRKLRAHAGSDGRVHLRRTVRVIRLVFDDRRLLQNGLTDHLDGFFHHVRHRRGLDSPVLIAAGRKQHVHHPRIQGMNLAARVADVGLGTIRIQALLERRVVLTQVLAQIGQPLLLIEHARCFPALKLGLERNSEAIRKGSALAGSTRKSRILNLIAHLHSGRIAQAAHRTRPRGGLRDLRHRIAAHDEITQAIHEVIVLLHHGAFFVTPVKPVFGTEIFQVRKHLDLASRQLLPDIKKSAFHTVDRLGEHKPQVG